MDFTKPILRALTLAKTEQSHVNYKTVTEKAAEYLANITGSGIDDYLKQFVLRETEEMFNQRKQITNSINPAIANSLMKPFYKVSRNNNVKKIYDFKDEKINSKVEIMLNDFNGDKIDNTDGFETWLKTRFIELSFSDPNGFVVLEWNAASKTETIKPIPFEVSSKEALNFEYNGSELVWLFVKNEIQYFKFVGGKTTTEAGAKYTLYGIGYTITIEQVDREYRAQNGLELENNQRYEEWQNKTFVMTLHETNLGFVPAFRIGYARDLATKGKSFVNPFDAAMPYFRKALKTVSELDITMTGHVFPQKLQYIQACTGASPQEPCYNGKTTTGTTCAACNGTGFKTITTAQEAIYLKMPESKEDFLPLNEMLVYKAPPIELVEFQNKYVKELKQEAHLAVYNSNMFLTSEYAKTATEVDSNMEGIYDAIEPFTERFSKAWRLVVYTCAVLSGFNENSDKFDLMHQFPSDPKLKTLSILYSDLKAVNDSGAPSFTRDVINNDIAEIIFSGDDAGLNKYKVRHEFFPFNGKSNDEIILFIGSQYVSENTKILYSNFEAIFNEIEFSDKNFYQKKHAEQKEILEKMVEKFKTEIIKNEPFNLDFGQLGAAAGSETEQNSGSNDGNTDDNSNSDANSEAIDNSDGNVPEV